MLFILTHLSFANVDFIMYFVHGLQPVVNQAVGRIVLFQPFFWECGLESIWCKYLVCVVEFILKKIEVGAF